MRLARDEFVIEGGLQDPEDEGDNVLAVEVHNEHERSLDIG